MSHVKTATLKVLAAQIGSIPSPEADAFTRTAKRWLPTYEAKPGMLYVRSRAISSRTNDNFDTFPAAEIAKAYRTFIGKPVFVNHHNADHRRARGVIIDAVLHEHVAPDGSPDTWVEVLMEIDAVKFPKLAKAILAGRIDRTSMGTLVGVSECSFCGNRASDATEFCSHITRHKGQRISRRNPETGKMESVLVHEICYDLTFFENSLLVEDPADPTAASWVDDSFDPEPLKAALGVTASLPRKVAGRGLRMIPGQSTFIETQAGLMEVTVVDGEYPTGTMGLKGSIDGRRVCELLWWTIPAGEVSDGHTSEGENVIWRIHTVPRHRRQGLARALVNLARESGVDLRHSIDLTDEGRAWRDAVGVRTAVTASLSRVNETEATGSRTASADTDLLSRIDWEESHHEGWWGKVVATLDGRHVGKIEWYPDGEIQVVEVAREYRRQGVATELLRRARQIDPRVFHSTGLSESGKAWSEKVGASGYQGGHTPSDDGPPAHDLLEGDYAPHDVYDNPHFYTGFTGQVLRETMDQINRVRGNPDAMVTIYRSLPPTVKNPTINTGDWVSLSREYAQMHGFDRGWEEWVEPKVKGVYETGEGWVAHEGDWPIVSAQVRAKDVLWDANDLAEWGYFGTSVTGRTASVHTAAPEDMQHAASADRQDPALLIVEWETLANQPGEHGFRLGERARQILKAHDYPFADLVDVRLDGTLPWGGSTHGNPRQDYVVPEIALSFEAANMVGMLHEVAHVLTVGYPWIPSASGPAHGPAWQATYARLLRAEGLPGTEPLIAALEGRTAARTAARTRTAALPAGITLRVDASEPVMPRVRAELPNGTLVGTLSWFAGTGEGNGEVFNVWVSEGYRRKGIATAMWVKAKERQPNLHHSTDLSEDGRAWSQKVAAMPVALATGDVTLKDGTEATLVLYDRPGGGGIVHCEVRRRAMGVLLWGADHVIEDILITPTWRRKGMATAMLEFARVHTPDLAHDEGNLTEMGAAWRSSVASLGNPDGTMTLYRGVNVELTDLTEAELETMKAGRTGAVVLSRLRREGSGRHWTASKDVALRFSDSWSRSEEPKRTFVGNWGYYVPVVLTAEVAYSAFETDGEELRDLMVQNYGWVGVTNFDEQEVTLKRGAPVSITSIEAALPNDQARAAEAMEYFEQPGHLPSAWQSLGTAGAARVATVHVPDDPSRYGDTSVRYELGGQAVLDPSSLPDRVYHVTTAGSRIGGVLRADFAQGGGLGGSSGEDRSVSFTVDKSVAEDIASGMRLLAKAARAYEAMPRATRDSDIIDVFVDLSREDGWDWSTAPEPEMMKGHSDFYGAQSAFFFARQSRGGKRNPLFFGVKPEAWARINPEDVGYVAATKADIIASGAMVTDFDLGSSYGLEEIRVWGDVRVGGFVRAGSYQMTHRPSMDGPPLHDLTSSEMVPADVYDHPEYYTGFAREQAGRECFEVIRKVRGKPDAMVTIYRSLPPNVPQEINPGDWVTLSRAYAEMHGLDRGWEEWDEAQDVWVQHDESWPVISRQVPAYQVRWAVDDLVEWGWDPSAPRTASLHQGGIEIEVQGPDRLDEFSVYARVGGQIVGRLTGGKWNAVEKVWVDPTHRRKGIATEMYRALEEAAAGAGLQMRRPDEFSDAGAAWYSNLTGKEYYSTWGSDVDWTDWSRRTAGAVASLSTTGSLSVETYFGKPGRRDHLTQDSTGTIPTDLVKDLPGKAGEVPGEHRKRHGAEWTEFVEDVRANGVRQPIFIVVEHTGEAWLYEGNHRRDAAVEAGQPTIPVTIRFFGKSEDTHPFGALR